MKSKQIGIAACLVFFVQILVVFGGQLPSDVELYLDNVHPLMEETTNTVVQEYLTSCLNGAESLKGLEAFDSRTSDAFDKLVESRRMWPMKLGAKNRRDPLVKTETDAFNEYLYPYRKAEYLNLVRLQDQLFERKYFKNETSKNANFIEGALNSHWSLTRADRGDPIKVLNDSTLGVSPWEALLRVEPAVAFDNGPQPALLGTFGLTRTFFPSTMNTTNGVTFSESIWSKYVQKAGLRVGAGVEIDGDQTDFVAGAGVQVWAVAVWGLYKPDDSEFLLGVSMSDLSKLKKIVGWFD